MYVPKDDYFVPVGLQRTNRKIGKIVYRGADESLAQPWKETSYSDQDLEHYTKTYGVQTTVIYKGCPESIQPF